MVLEMILGIVMIYAWIHAIVIIVKKIKKLTRYEHVVMWTALVAAVLFFIGSY